MRIGTAELYRQVEQFPEVAECLAVGQKWDGDERVILFVKLASGAVLETDIENSEADLVSLQPREGEGVGVDSIIDTLDWRVASVM